MITGNVKFREAVVWLRFSTKSSYWLNRENVWEKDVTFSFWDLPHIATGVVIDFDYFGDFFGLSRIKNFFLDIAAELSKLPFVEVETRDQFQICVFVQVFEGVDHFVRRKYQQQFHVASKQLAYNESKD